VQQALGAQNSFTKMFANLCKNFIDMVQICSQFAGCQEKTKLKENHNIAGLAA